mgnify:CR=1 FL=1
MRERERENERERERERENEREREKEIMRERERESIERRRIYSKLWPYLTLNTIYKLNSYLLYKII